MYFLYILESIPTGRWYIGSTDDIDRRLKEHNRGITPSTKPFVPYRLIYKEVFESRTEARRREIAVKRSGVIRKQLKERLTTTAPSSNG